MRRVILLAALLTSAAGPIEPASTSHAKSLLTDGKYAEAANEARTLLTEVEQRDGTTSLEVARILDVLVEALWRGGKATAPGTRDLAQRAITIKSALLDPNDVEVAHSLGNLAIVERISGRYGAARPLYERALAILETALSPDAPEVATAVNNLGILLQWQGEYLEAQRAFERALRIREKSPGRDSPQYAQSLSNLAGVLMQVGDYAEALRFYQDAIAIKEKILPPGSPEIATTLGNFAGLLRETGDYRGAMAAYQRALGIMEKAPNANPIHRVNVQSNIALVLSDMGDYATAIDLYEKAIADATTLVGPDHPDLATMLADEASAYRRIGALDRAKALNESALAIREGRLPAGHKDVASSLFGLAQVLSDMGNTTAALPMYERALAIWEKALGRENPAVADCLASLARLFEVTGDRSAALRAQERALAIRQSALGSTHPLVGLAMADLAELRFRSGDAPGALEAGLRAEEIGRDHLRLTVATLAERPALRYASIRASGSNVVLSLAADGPGPAARRSAWDVLIRSRALVLDEMARRHRAAWGVQDAPVVRSREDLRVASTRLANLSVRSLGDQDVDRYRRLLDQAGEQKEQAERTLAETSATFREERALARSGGDDIAKALPPNAAIVSFARYLRMNAASAAAESRAVPSYIAFVMKQGDEAPSVVPIGTAQEIDALVDEWRDEVSIEPPWSFEGRVLQERRSRTAGEKLRRAVWDPVAEHLSGTDRVFVVPDYSLHLVNLSALPVGEGRYLVEEPPVIHYLSTERDLLMEEPERSKQGLVVLGAPAYDEALHLRSAGFRGERSACGEFASLRFLPLPGTLKEIDDVQRAWNHRRDRVTGGVEAGPEAVRMVGLRANEAAFKQAAFGHRILHLATHGFFVDGARCVSEWDASRTNAENPLLVSGLALAGANRRASSRPDEEDGVLTAEEIAALDLSSVEWVVLSACDTGLGELRMGEGVFGLRRAFQLAGARTVIMSLWSVEDEAARRWMRALYQARLVDSQDTADSVRQASLRVLADLRRKQRSTHPFYWAGFVAVEGWS